MPIIINLLISGGVIWFLLIVFNEGGNLKYVQQQAFIIMGMVTVVGLVVAVLLPPSLALLIYVVHAAVLFVGVEKVCDFSRGTAVRVTIWYVVIMFTIGLGFGGVRTIFS